METNVFLTTAWEIERMPAFEYYSIADEFILHPSCFILQHAVEIDGDAPLIAFAEAADA